MVDRNFIKSDIGIAGVIGVIVDRLSGRDGSSPARIFSSAVPNLRPDPSSICDFCASCAFCNFCDFRAFCASCACTKCTKKHVHPSDGGGSHKKCTNFLPPFL